MPLDRWVVGHLRFPPMKSRFQMVILLYLALLPRPNLPCQFPSELSSRELDESRGWIREWHGRIKDEFQESLIRINFNGSTMHTTSTASESRSSTRVCVAVVGTDRYLVTHDETADEGRTRQYTCLRFVFLSPDVFQISSANLSRSMDQDLCSDVNMALDKWLVLDKASLGRSKQPSCPIHGGFNIKVFDKMRREGVCDAYQGEIRFESECTVNDGLTFYFRTQKCVPDGMMMRGTQPTICLSNWRSGSYTFVLLKHNYEDYVWLLRYPTVNDGLFTAYLFKDLLVDTVEFVRESFNYLRMDTAHEEPWNPTSLCEDDYEVCSHRKAPCSSDSQQMIMTCPRTCGLCAQVQPVMCSLPNELTGNWYDAANDELHSTLFSFNSTNLVIRQNHSSLEVHTYRCIQWQNVGRFSRTSGVQVNNASIMLVTNFPNGCKPRYTCMKVIQQSSSFLHVAMSNSRQWPLVRNSSELITCESMARHHHDFYSHHKMLFNTQKKPQRENCDFPKALNNSVSVRHRDGSECAGKLSEKSNKMELKLNLTGCRHLESSLACLKSFRIPSTNDLVIITKPTQSNSSGLYCWLFPSRQNYPFYLLIGQHCQHVNKQQRAIDVPAYDAIFIAKLPKPTPSTPPVLTLSLSTPKFHDLTNTVNLSTTTLSILTEQSTLKPSSIVAVAFVALIFAVIQVLVFCKCSQG